MTSTAATTIMSRPPPRRRPMTWRDAASPGPRPGRSPRPGLPRLRRLTPPHHVHKAESEREGPRRCARYGFRVPAVIVSPYARPDYVCSQTLDHTSVLKLIEEKWNLPPLTRRDAPAAGNAT